MSFLRMVLVLSMVTWLAELKSRCLKSSSFTCLAFKKPLAIASPGGGGGGSGGGSNGVIVVGWFGEVVVVN